MGKITSINEKRTTIEFSDFCIRVFAKYRGSYCSEIRVWKLPSGGGFLSMFNTKNLVWAMYGDATKAIHGWFTPPPVTQPNDKRHWLQVFSDGIAGCRNYDEVKEYLTDIEGMLAGDSKSMAKLALTNSDRK